METKQRLITVMLALVAMFMGTKVMAQEVNLELVQEIDWTQQDSYYNGVWYDNSDAVLSFDNGLVIDNTSDGTGNYWEPQVPIIAKIPEISAGEYYQVKFTVDAPAAGEIRLDFCSWDGSKATMVANIDVEKGLKEYTADFINYPTSCTNAMVFYQCGKIPGKHTIKKVQVWRKVPEAYAELSNDGKTLTFRYDLNKSSYGSNAYDVNNSFPGWKTPSTLCDAVETVVFEESFEDARPTSTWFWFESMNNLSSIIGLEYLNTSEVTNMSYMFAGCYKLSEINLSGFDTSKVTNMSNMFLSCSSLKTLDLSSFNTQSVTNMQFMFGWCLELETIIVGENWSTELVTSSDYMFSGCTSIIGGAGTIFDENHLDKGYAHIDEGTSDRGYLSATLPEAYAELSNDGKTLTFRYDSNKSSYGSNAYYLNEGNNLPGWNGITTIETVVFEESFATVRPVSTRSWFDGFNSLTEFVGMEYLNTSEVTTMEAMFGGCKSITNLDLSHFNTSKVTNMQSMFVTCEKLKEINLRGFDTSKVTSMQIMFIGCVVLETLNLGSFNTSNVTNMQMMFANCSMLKTIYVGGGWSVANAGCFGMFTECKNLTGGQGTTYDAGHTAADYAHIDGGESAPGYLTAAPPEAYAVYDPQAKTLSFCYDSNKSIYGENGYYLNEGATAPGWIDFSNPKVIQKVVFTSSFQNVQPLSTFDWFYNQPSLTEIVDIKYLNTSSVENMSGMFYNCSSLTELDVSGFDTQNVTTMSLMFDRCSGLTNLYLVNFDTRNVSKMHYMFEGCTNLTTITVGVNWNTTNVESSDNMFYGCTSIVGGAGTRYDENHLDKEYAIADGLNGKPGYLTALPPEAYAVYNRSSDNVSTLTFYYDNLRNTIQRIGIKKYDLNEGFYTPGWISDERFIEKVVFDESFKDARPTSTYCWFMGLKSLDTFVGWRNLNTSEVTTMNQMFMECSSLTSVDLSAFDTKKVQTMNSMFDGCTKLKTITVGANWNTANVTTSSYMFSGCTSIVGGAGTTYNINKVDKEYAIADGLNGNPGYLTAVSYGITVSGKAVTFANKYDVLGNETVNYDDALKTLTLINADVSSINIAATAPNDLLIKVNGECEVKNELGNAFTSDIANLTIEGPGKLTIGSTRRIGIKLGHNAGLIVDDVDLIVSGSTGIEGSYIGVTYNCHLGFFNANCTVTSKVTSSPSVNDIFSLKLIDCIMTSGKFDRQNHMVIGNPMIIQRSGGISTDINTIDNGQLTMDKSLPLYNLNGQRVSHPVKGQIYIQNGRKIKF